MSEVSHGPLTSRTGELPDLGPAQGHSKKVAIILFSAATFWFWVALYLYVPILPTHAESLGAGLSLVGAIIASYAIGQVLLRVPIGVLADNQGRAKPFIAAGMLFAILGAFLMAIASGPWLLFVGRAITGLAAATWVVSSSSFALYFSPQRSARGIGIISFVSSMAMVLATLLGGRMAQLWGPTSVFLIGATFGVVSLLSLVPVEEPFQARRRGTSREPFLTTALHPLLLLASFMGLLVQLASAATISSFTLIYASRLGGSSADLGMVSAVYLGSATLATLGAVYLIERRGYPAAIVLGAAVMAAALLATPFVTSLGALQGLQVANGAGRGLTHTALMALSISAIPLAHRMTAMGVFQGLYAVGMVIGPIIAGIAAEQTGIASVFYLSGASLLPLCVLARLRIVAGRRPTPGTVG